MNPESCALVSAFFPKISWKPKIGAHIETHGLAVHAVLNKSEPSGLLP